MPYSIIVYFSKGKILSLKMKSIDALIVEFNKCLCMWCFYFLDTQIPFGDVLFEAVIILQRPGLSLRLVVNYHCKNIQRRLQFALCSAKVVINVHNCFLLTPVTITNILNSTLSLFWSRKCILSLTELSLLWTFKSMV